MKPDTVALAQVIKHPCVYDPPLDPPVDLGRIAPVVPLRKPKVRQTDTP